MEQGRKNHVPENRFKQLINRGFSLFKPGESLRRQEEAGRQIETRLKEAISGVMQPIAPDYQNLDDLNLDEITEKAVQHLIEDARKEAKFENNRDWLRTLYLALRLRGKSEEPDKVKILGIWKQQEKFGRLTEKARANEDNEEGL